VGAFNVGRITASFAENASVGQKQLTNLPTRKPRLWRFDPPVAVGRGDEIMAFHLGSTVILLFEAQRANLDVSVVTGNEVRLGSQIAVSQSEK
jgi:phosphatidylserine decarboxylase